MAASEAHKAIKTDHTGPSPGADEVTPHDSTLQAETLGYPIRSLYIGVSGNVSVRMADGQDVVFVGAPVGVLPIQVQLVKSTGTTATNIVALA